MLNIFFSVLVGGGVGGGRGGKHLRCKKMMTNTVPNRELESRIPETCIGEKGRVLIFVKKWRQHSHLYNVQP